MSRLLRLSFTFTLSVGALAAVLWLGRMTSASGHAATTQPTPELYSPSFSPDDVQARRNSAPHGLANSSTLSTVVSNCRFGYNLARQPITYYNPADLARLRASWFGDWSVEPAPPRVNGMDFVQVVRLHQTKTGPNWDDPYVVPYTYTIQSPAGATLSDSLAQLQTIVANNPGAIWLVGNEIEREDWTTDGITTERQDEILPELYAVAYHQIYTAIKAGDPTAQVAIGGIVEATPLRLEYLDRVWKEYYRLYGERMPVDIWNVHAFVLPERRYYPGCTDCWGAGVPAGIYDVQVGEQYTSQDNKDFNIIREHLIAFREWMRDIGEQNKPLIISEYGVLMPEEFAGFSFPEVRDAFMYPSFDLMLNEKDPDLGYPADDYRLVQRVMWFSLDYDKLRLDSNNQWVHVFNGYLFRSGLNDGETAGIAPLGEYWETYVTLTAPTTVDLLPAVAWVDPPAAPWTGSPVTVTLNFEVANAGHISATTPFTVEVYEDGGPLLGTAVVNSLAGCGDKVVVQTPWTGLNAGVHYARVRVDTSNAVSEESETNNEKVLAVLVSTDQLYLPLVTKNIP